MTLRPLGPHRGQEPSPTHAEPCTWRPSGPHRGLEPSRADLSRFVTLRRGASGPAIGLRPRRAARESCLAGPTSTAAFGQSGNNSLSVRV
jgi:hypothetical protein